MIDDVIERDFPFLGLCYGVGVLTSTLGGVVDRTYGEAPGRRRRRSPPPGGPIRCSRASPTNWSPSWATRRPRGCFPTARCCWPRASSAPCRPSGSARASTPRSSTRSSTTMAWCRGSRSTSARATSIRPTPRSCWRWRGPPHHRGVHRILGNFVRLARGSDGAV
ncbi:hypothetical protein [Tessaracoccus coleopterorum]|uniref:hypothetical protein n=1 Tax=Tessaracoccus coleopterorum TaxID=2714950 RepID=UPI0018D4722E|nr:hypothetical protein [Tessaracoccus coleopterorum]